MTYNTDKERNEILEEIAFQLERIADALEDKGDGGEEVTDNPSPTPSAPQTSPTINGYWCMNCGQWVMMGAFHQCSGRSKPYQPWTTGTYYYCSKCGMRLTSGGYHICSGSGSPNISGSSSTWPGGYWNWNTNT